MWHLFQAAKPTSAEFWKQHSRNGVDPAMEDVHVWQAMGHSLLHDIMLLPALYREVHSSKVVECAASAIGNDILTRQFARAVNKGFAQVW